LLTSRACPLASSDPQDVADRLRTGLATPSVRTFDIEIDEEDGDSTRTRTTSPGAHHHTLHLTRTAGAVTPQTTFAFDPSREFDSSFVGDMATLVSDHRGRDDFTVLSVDVATGEVNGMQRGRHGETRRISLEDGGIPSGIPHRGRRGRRRTEAAGGGKRLVMRTVERVERNFTCGVDKEDEHHEGHGSPGRRGLGQDHHHHRHHHHHHTHDHDHHDDHKQQDRGHRGLGHADSHGNEAQPHTNLRASLARTMMGVETPSKEVGELPSKNPLSTASGAHPGFTINLLVVIDAQFINHQGGAQQAARYVDHLINSANAIFSSEVDARLNVVRVEETAMFDKVKEGAGAIRTALSEMRKEYEGKFGPDTADGEVDLVHALLGKDVGGGMAFIDTVCDSTWGVGLSSGLRGRVDKLDDDAMNDAFMVAHELGHSLGSGEFTNQAAMVA